MTVGELSQATPASAGTAGLFRKLRAHALSLVLMAAVLALWEFGSNEGMSNILPRPSVILRTVVEIWPVLWRNTQTTMVEAGLGFFYGTVIGVLIAVGFIYSRTVAQTVYPYAVILRSLPLMALLPILISFFGVGVTAKVIIIVLSVFFPTLVNVVQGLTSMDKQALELMQTLNASQAQIFWKVRAPFALPYLFVSIKVTSSSAILAAIISEWMFASKGLGALIVNSMFNAEVNDLWAAMFVATMLSILAYLICVFLERWLVPWRQTAHQAGGEE